jgi:hypothetical protein
MLLTCILILISNLNPLVLKATICNESQWKVTGNSRLEILGSTNVNEFECLSVDYEGEDIMKEVCYRVSETPSLYGEIVMKSTGFDCHNSMMTKDFAKTVQSEIFPEITIRFLGLTENAETQLSGKVSVTIAGKSKLYTVFCVVKEKNRVRKHLEGDLTIRFTDFNLQPPQKLFGAIKVSDALKVKFHLKLQKIRA